MSVLSVHLISSSKHDTIFRHGNDYSIMSIVSLIIELFSLKKLEKERNFCLLRLLSLEYL